MTIGKSRAKVYVETDTKVTFKDVAGVDEAKFELQETVSFPAYPEVQSQRKASCRASGFNLIFRGSEQAMPDRAHVASIRP